MEFKVVFTNNMPEAKKRFMLGISKVMDAISNEYRGDLYKTLSVPPNRHGKIYFLPDGTLHQASRPGEPPAVLTDLLRGSLRVENISESPHYSNAVITDAPYASDLELGTGPFREDEARPAWEPTMRQNEAKYRKMVDTFMNDV